MVLEILCVEPIYPQYSGVLETCFDWFFEVLGSESVYILWNLHSSKFKLYGQYMVLHGLTFAMTSPRV